MGDGNRTEQAEDVRRRVLLERVANVVLALSFGALALPVWRGGWLASGDHAPHIAELESLAHSASGWSDIAFAGFPLGVLHSPLCYGLLIALVRLGVSARIAYLLGLTLGQVVLGASALWVAQKRMAAPLAQLVATCVVTQSYLAVGASGTLSGMWTFGVSVGLVLLLADRLFSDLTPRDALHAATLLGLVGLAHTFAIYASVFLVAARALPALSEPAPLRKLATLGAVGLVGAAASSAYWATAALTIDRAAIVPTTEAGIETARIVLHPLFAAGLDPLAMLRDRADTLPDLLLLVLALVGVARLPGASRAARTMASVSLVALALANLAVAHVAELPDPTALGPIPWRILVIARCLLLFVAALAAPRAQLDGHLASASAAPDARRLAWTLLGVALSIAWTFVRTVQVARQMPGTESVEYRTSAEALAWLSTLDDDARPTTDATHEPPSRLYVQNTFGHAPGGLRWAHPMSLAAASVHRPVVGSFYSLVPFATDRWLASTAGDLVGLTVTPSHRAEIGLRLDRLAVGDVLACHDATIRTLRRWDELEEVGHSGPFVLFHRRSLDARPVPWVVERESGAALAEVRYDDGELAFTAPTEGTFDVAVSWSRRLHVVEGPAGVTLAQRADGLLAVHVPAPARVVVRYEPPSAPWALTLVVWALLALAHLETRGEHVSRVVARLRAHRPGASAR